MNDENSMLIFGDFSCSYQYMVLKITVTTQAKRDKFHLGFFEELDPWKVPQSSKKDP